MPPRSLRRQDELLEREIDKKFLEVTSNQCFEQLHEGDKMKPDVHVSVRHAENNESVEGQEAIVV